jgi:integrase
MKRGNGQGSAIKTGKTYRAVLNHYEDGKRYQKTKRGFKTKRAALEWCAANSTWASTDCAVTFSDVYKEWSAAHYPTISDKRQKQYAHVYEVSKSLHDKRMKDLGVRHYQAVLNTQKNTNATRKMFRQVFSMMSDYAIRAGYIATNYARLCELPKEGKPMKRAFTEAEIQKMEKLYATTKDLAAGAALIMIYTGMRWGEISTVDPKNIHLDEGYLIGGIKTDAGKHGEILLIEHIRPIVQELMIPVNRIGKLSSEGFRKAYNKMQEDLGIPRHTVHECRHTTATILAQKGIQPAVITEIMRHTSYSQTMDYTHIQRDDKLAGLDKMVVTSVVTE